MSFRHGDIGEGLSTGRRTVMAQQQMRNISGTECALSVHVGVFSPQPTGRMQPRVAINAAQHKIVNLIKPFFFAHQFMLVFVYLMCGPRQLFFFQCGSGMPKGWIPLGSWPTCTVSSSLELGNSLKLADNSPEAKVHPKVQRSIC